MKHILKPVGHCLATAVITSTLLRVYPASIADAADTPEIQPIPSETAQSEAAAIEAPIAGDRSPAAASSPPGPVAVESIVSPEIAGTVIPQTADSQPAAAAQSSESQPAANAAASPAIAPAPTSGTALSPPQTSPRNLSKQATKPSAAQPNTIAAMRQQLEEKLAAIVARDKATREAQLQQNLMRVALHYAETGAFEPARQVARHPALPLELQTALLEQIDQIAAETANQPAPQKPQTRQSQVAAASPGGAGRTIPSDAIVAMPLGQTWSGAFGVPPFAAQQCPVTDAPAAATVSDRQNTRPNTRQTPDQSSNSTSQKKSLPRFGNRAATTLAAAIRESNERTIERTTPKPGAATARSSADKTADKTADKATGKPAVKPAAKSGSAPAIEALTLPRFAPSATAAQSQPLVPADQADSLAMQPLSPLEIMGYWISKPLKEVGLRLPLMPALFSSASETDRETVTPEPTIAATATESFPALSSRTATGTATGAETANLAQPVLRFSPYLLDLKQSLADLQFAAKDAVKLSLPTVQVSQKAVSPAAASTPAAIPNCFTPADGSIALSPALTRQMGWGNFIFPLPIPAALTSAFGWRIHPISGDRRFHAGIDLGAPMGTPVVAAKAGRIIAADYLGGYGLAVVVETIGGSYRNLYAHLSGIAVRPGTTVQQGTVLGWVGSTGNSTGPHLHFETQIPTTNGWMAIDPLAAVAERMAEREVGE